MRAIDQSAEIIRLRNVLRMQRERVRHWDRDVSCNLKPTRDSLHDALDEIDAVLNSQREPHHAQ